MWCGRLLNWFRGYDGLDEAAQRFLAGSNDLADLERRLRALEYNGMRVMPVTFNH
jgi:hypothetical protein